MRIKARLLVSIVVVFSLLMAPVSAAGSSTAARTAAAGNVSPFAGWWLANNIGGGEIRLTIAGPVDGPFKLTWAEEFSGYCDGGPALARGNGTLSADSPLLQGALRVSCIQSEKSIDIYPAWSYDPSADTIALTAPDPVLMTWYRRGAAVPKAAFAIAARPAQDWVEGTGFPEGSLVSLYIHDAERRTLFFETAVSVYPEADPSAARVEFSLDYDMQPGDHLWMTDGKTIKDLVVTDLAVTAIDQSTMTVTGAARPGSEVILEPAPGALFSVTAGPDGAWTYSAAGMPLGAEIWLSQADEDLDLTRQAFYLPSPRFSVYPQWETLEGWNWPFSALVRLSIDDPATAVFPDYEKELTPAPGWWNQGESWLTDNLPAGYDLKAGDLVTLDDGSNRREHTVRSLSVTAVDAGANTVSGKADPGARVYAWPLATGQQVAAVADGEGNWLADFNTIGVDLLPGMGGRSAIPGENGGETAVDWHIPNPRFSVLPVPDAFEGVDWPEGAAVTITVTGKPECSEIQTSFDHFFKGSFGEGCDIAAGDQVIFTDGATTREHTVRSLEISTENGAKNTVSGKAAPGARVSIWPLATGQQVAAAADGEGNWLADFNEIRVRLRPGMEVRSAVSDESGSETAVDWRIPNPHFTIYPNQDRLEAFEWPRDAAVHLAIDDPNTKLKPDFERDLTAVPAPWDAGDWWISLDFAGIYDAKPGDQVVMTDGATMRAHTIRGLAVTQFNVDADTLSGTADPGVTLYAWPDETGQEIRAAADGDGNWKADFAGVFDLGPGKEGWVVIRDAPGNRTAVGWTIPDPRFSVFPELDAVEGWEWPCGAPVRLAVDDPQTEASPDVEQDLAPAPSGTDSDNCRIAYQFSGAYDVKAGDAVTLRSSGIARAHTVQPLAVTGIDSDANTIRGTANPGAVIRLRAGETGEEIQVTTAESGVWTASFDGVAALLPGSTGRLAVRGEQGGETALDWRVPDPKILVELNDDTIWLSGFPAHALVSVNITRRNGKKVLWHADDLAADRNGDVVIHAEDTGLDLVPGSTVTAQDGTLERSITLEEVTFDQMDMSTGHAEGTVPAPPGRKVWVGVGFPDGVWERWVESGEGGRWIAEFDAPVPDTYQWLAVKVFDEDGDACEAHPSAAR